METVFDSLKFYDDLKAADVPEKQARTQAKALRAVFASYDASRMNELATKGDIQDARYEIQNVRQEIRETELRILKWVLGTILIVQTALIIAAMGFAVAILAR